MARKLRASCCIVTIASGGGRDVTVLQGGRRVAPTHPVGAHTMQEIIPHYLALGIDRFAYAGHGCLKASLTTAALVRAPDRSWRHFITMYAVVTVARTMQVDKTLQFGIMVENASKMTSQKQKDKLSDVADILMSDTLYR